MWSGPKRMVSDGPKYARTSKTYQGHERNLPRPSQRVSQGEGVARKALKVHVPADAVCNEAKLEIEAVDRIADSSLGP
jgi:hypothetical protein